MSILGSREQFCVNSKVNKGAATKNKNEECKKLIKGGDCGYFHGVHKVPKRNEREGGAGW